MSTPGAMTLNGAVVVREPGHPERAPAVRRDLVVALGAHAQDARVGGGVVEPVLPLALVAHRGHDQGPALGGPQHGVLEGPRVAVAAGRDVDDLGAVDHGVADAPDHGVVAAAALAVGDLHRDDLGGGPAAGSDPHDAHAVRRGGRDAGHVRAVAREPPVGGVVVAPPGAARGDQRRVRSGPLLVAVVDARVEDRDARTGSGHGEVGAPGRAALGQAPLAHGGEEGVREDRRGARRHRRGRARELGGLAGQRPLGRHHVLPAQRALPRRRRIGGRQGPDPGLRQGGRHRSEAGQAALGLGAPRGVAEGDHEAAGTRRHAGEVAGLVDLGRPGRRRGRGRELARGSGGGGRRGGGEHQGRERDDVAEARHAAW